MTPDVPPPPAVAAPLQAAGDDPVARGRRAAQALDHALRAGAAPWTSGLSPVALGLAWADWTLNLATQPAQALQLGWAAARGLATAAAAAAAGQPVRQDQRFDDPAWSRWPWSALAHGHQAAEGWWTEASTLPGMQPHHAALTRFMAARLLDAAAPSNLPALNPALLARTRERLGSNLVDGARLAVDDWRRQHGLAPLAVDGPAWRPGIEVACTPGRVVYRNHLVELIQYLPQTARVQREPVLIVPSWIMKYYVLDLSPPRSMVRWLVAQGHTVFIISWRNPDESDAALTMQDYLQLGVFDVLSAIGELIPETPVHACGYCLGGTLLAVAAAALCDRRRQLVPPSAARLAGLTLLAAETDFSEPGELGVLIDEAQVASLEAMMARQGFLDGRQMADSFTFLHARELYWAARLRAYGFGEAPQPDDLMAWNADVTRMPAAMHGEYLRRCYLRNEIAEGRFPVRGEPVSLSAIDLPLFVVATETDHVAPWPSVFKIHRLTCTELCFVLTNGGHNAGIVSVPGHPRRHHALSLRRPGDPDPDPLHWRAGARHHDGSWWTRWHTWLVAHGDGQVTARTPLQDPLLGDAPGRYVAVRYPG